MTAHVAVFATSTIAPDAALLSALEREALAALRGDRRRDEWIRGRIAIRRVLGDPTASVLNDGDGAPLVIGTPRSVSLSHDDDWIAVAVSNTGVRIGIDLCARAHAERVASVLAWLGVRGDELDPIVRWAALEAVLKLRGWSIETLRDAALEVRAAGDALVVRGLGPDATVQTKIETDYALAWAVEPR